MAGVNKVILLGNLGRDPELNQTKKGTYVCRLNLATTRTWFNKDTQSKMEETEWHRISVWGNQAQSCNNHLSKGRPIYVEGRLQTSKYEQDGVTKYSTEIIADTVQFLGDGKNSGGGRKDNGGGGPPLGGGGPPLGGDKGSPSTSGSPSNPGDFVAPVGGDDIPF